MTAGSYMYIGPQGIVHGTTLTVLNAIRKMTKQDTPAKGRLFVTAGLGGMSGAQPKAGNIAGVISEVLILGATFKENVPDLRNSQALDLVRKIRGYGANIVVVDPYADLFDNSNPIDDGTLLLSPEKLQNLQQSFDVIVFAVAHDAFKNGGWPFVS